jgi:hypothetical protein
MTLSDTSATTKATKPKTKYLNPITGEAITFSDHIAWQLQSVIRRWWFLSAFTILTAIAWATGNATIILWWNFGASYLAIFVESIVGRAMFGQTKADAAILRRIDKFSEEDFLTHKREIKLDERTMSIVEEILARVKDLEGNLTKENPQETDNLG